MSGYLITDIYHECEKEIPVYKWDFVQMKDEMYRFYHTKPEEGAGRFLFYSMEETAYSDENTRWGEYTEVECVFHGIGYFDGVRHLYMGDEQTSNAGYIYYPDANILIEIMKEIDKLDKKYDTTIDD